MPESFSKNTKSQLALEFVLLIGISVAVTMAVIVVMYDLNRGGIEDKIEVKMKDFGFKVHRELLLAYEMNSGYERNFTLPTQVEKTDYNVSILNNNTFTLQYRDRTMYYKLPFIHGNITKGFNVLRNIDGNVSLN